MRGKIFRPTGACLGSKKGSFSTPLRCFGLQALDACFVILFETFGGNNKLQVLPHNPMFHLMLVLVAANGQITNPIVTSKVVNMMDLTTLGQFLTLVQPCLSHQTMNAKPLTTRTNNGILTLLMCLQLFTIVVDTSTTRNLKLNVLSGDVLETLHL